MTRALTVDKIQDKLAETITCWWEDWQAQRMGKMSEWQELRDYLFATDTSSTSAGALPWKNKTTLPKLCQIRDNLHSNYVSALFPNDEWLKWEGYSREDATLKKKSAIQAYMSNKTRTGGFRTVASQLLYDYIDYGNAFAMPAFESSYRELADGTRATKYVGPKAVRISPLDIVFDPTVAEFDAAPKIIRSMLTEAEMYARAEEYPEDAHLMQVFKKRKKMLAKSDNFGLEQMGRIRGFNVDGFGSYIEYLRSGFYELLTFYGDVYDKASGEYLRGRKIEIIDRCTVISNEPIPTWFGGTPIYHVGWRTRPDNLWSMGPLDNLVGMQYRIDHLENLKADAMDLAVLPPLVIAGEVEEFEWAPGAEIHLDENGTVTELGRNAQWVIAANNDISLLEERMEMYAGAPREAMGIRTAGEKTAFEVQQLQNAAGRIFQEKINSFEIQLLEPLLNAMLEYSVRNFNGDDIIRALDNDLGVSVFQTITRDDITANGVLRPIGARHYAAQAQLLQNMTGIFNTPVGQMIAPHTSSKALATMVEDIMGVERFGLFRPFVALIEQQEGQKLAMQGEEEVGMYAQAPVDGVEPVNPQEGGMPQ